VRQLKQSIIGSHSKTRSQREGMMVDLEASREAHKKYAAIKEERRSGHHLAGKIRATAYHTHELQRGEGAGNMLCSGPRGCLGG
jgi:hypothetical protein